MVCMLKRNPRSEIKVVRCSKAVSQAKSNSSIIFELRVTDVCMVTRYYPFAVRNTGDGTFLKECSTIVFCSKLARSFDKQMFDILMIVFQNTGIDDITSHCFGIYFIYLKSFGKFSIALQSFCMHLSSKTE